MSRNQFFATATFGVSAQLMLDIFDIVNETASIFVPDGGVSWILTFEPLPAVIFSHARKTGGNVLGLTPAEGPAFGAHCTSQSPRNIKLTRAHSYSA